MSLSMGVKSIDQGPLSPAIVLVRPREEGNIGAAARAMANMGLAELVLVEPEAEIGRVARAFAVGAGHILDSARHAPSLDDGLAPYQKIVGTTSARARGLPMATVSARELPGALRQESSATRTALVFGPEVSGLDNDQLARCGLLVRIPCAPIQPTLNLAQAVLVISYELHLARLEATDASEGLPTPVPTHEIDGLFAQVGPLLAEIGFQRDDTFAGVVRDLRRLAARAGVTEREVRILRGICRRAQRALEHR
jgi:tRNA (cytidine32/uridine32-2'-O)-methyltransferase